MAAALGPAATLLGKVFSMLSEAPVAAYVDSLELGHNSEQIKAKLAHTRGLLHNAQVSDVGHNPGLQDLLLALSRNADQAEDLLDELHYFQIHDRLHGTSYATTKSSFLRHGHNALRHTARCWAACFSCSSAQDDGDSASGDDDDHGDELSFDPVTMSRKIKWVLQDMQNHCDSVSDLLGHIPINSMTVALHRPQIGSTIIQDTLYGRGDTFEKTVNRIMSNKQTVSVLPIVGPGGIGKTTFTQHLYNDDRTKEHFDVWVWVCVSTDFDVLKLTREILGCISTTEGEGSSSVANGTTNLDQLQKSIAHHLKSKRFLIVLDDIWKCGSDDQWKTVLAPFTKGEANGSMVLVTTRFPKLAEMMKTPETLELAGLESNDFFTFFEACIFGDHKPEHYEDELAGIAQKIADKLKGSPLAAKTVGRLLQKKLSQEHWNGVLKNSEWLKQKNDDDIMPSLKISYDYLPFDLKKCFSYFGLFPEDRRFDNSEMNHFFVAIGIIDSIHQHDMNYLEELVHNGFLMKGADDDDDGDEYYVLHDLMHELSRTVSAEECLNISDLGFRAADIPKSVRHLSVTIEDTYDGNFEEEMYKLRDMIGIANLRTLMIFENYEERVAKLFKDVFKEINSLRVLVISPETFPHRFLKLIHLQYLKISPSYYYGDFGMELCSTISRFYHLKFVDLDGQLGSFVLPEDFSNLENLRDFRAESELHSNIRNVGKIKHLQRLHEFHVKKESTGFELREVGALTELEGKLIIRGLQHVAIKEEATAAKLMLKRNLKGLELLWNKDRPTIDAGILDSLKPHSNLRVLTIANPGCTIGPSWLCVDIWLTSLETLTLEGLSWSTLPPFGKLPNLKTLTLKRISGMRQFGPGCGGAPGKCFMRLKEVGFHEMSELAEWVVEPNCCSFPCLEIVGCIKCPNLHVMPISEVFWTNLCKLRVSGCPKMSVLSMAHTSKLSDLVAEGADSEELTYDGEKLELLWNRNQPDINVDILDALQPDSDLRVLTIVNHGGAIGPSWLCLDIWLISLDTLTLEGISWSTLPPFGKLPNLKVLTLERISGMRQFQCGGTPGKCFMRLKEIGFHEMPELAEWVVEPNCHSFPSLEIIRCIKCPNLRGMPFSEVSCTSLRNLRVFGCPKMSLPSMPHTSTLKFFVVEGANSERLTYDGNKLLVHEYSGALAFHNLDKVEDMSLVRVSHISVLEVMTHLGSLRKLCLQCCEDLVLVPVVNGEGIQEDNSSLQSLKILLCGKLFSRWPLGEAGGGAQTIYPFPASLRKLEVRGEESLKSMALLSNLTSLTSLELTDCSNLTVDGFNPLTAVNLKKLEVTGSNAIAADLLSEVARTKLLPAGHISRLEVLTVDDISGLLVAPICNLLAPTLHTLKFYGDKTAESFTEEQDKALQLLNSLQNLEFFDCEDLQSLPQGLHRLSSLKELTVLLCSNIESLPKEGFPVSLGILQIDDRNPEIDEQIEKIKRTNPDLSVSRGY